MKSTEPSRTALLVARQRAAHQVLDRGSILNDPFAMKILNEDEEEVLQFANGHPLSSIGRLFTTARSRIAEEALSRAVEEGIKQIVILGAGLDTFALRNPHRARQIRIFEVDHAATQAWKRQRLAESATPTPTIASFRASRFRAGRFAGEACRRWASAGLTGVFQLARCCAISDAGRRRRHTGLHRVNSALGGGVRLYGTHPSILRRDAGINSEANRAAREDG
jgi:Leucine carboxyl methyltransferase